MRLNVSQVLDFNRCPIVWYNRYVLQRGVEPTDALGDGTYWHQLAEAWLKGESLLPQASNPVQDRMRHFVEEGGLPHIPVVATEIAFEMPLGKHTLVGTLDGIMPDPDSLGGFFSLQWKTCQGKTDVDRQSDAVQWSYHEAAYEALMNYNGYPCSGTYLGIYRKLTKGELMVGGINPLTFHVLKRPPEYITKILAELEEWADKMDEAISSGPSSLLPHRRSCIMGNIKCQYHGSCYEGVPLSDDRYIDIASRYTEPSDETS